MPYKDPEKAKQKSRENYFKNIEARKAKMRENYLLKKRRKDEKI